MHCIRISLTELKLFQKQMSEKPFVSLLIINSGWNEKIHLRNEKRGREMGSYVHFCPRETGFENDQNGGWIRE